MNDVIEILGRVIRTLNTVDVHGKSNLNALLGSIQALEQVHTDLAEAKKKAADAEHDKG